MDDSRQVLVIEDIAPLREALAERAADVFGVARAHEAGSLAEARAWLRDHREIDLPLIALVDLGLPDGSGDAIISELAGDSNATCIVTTIFEDDGNVMRALGAGAQGYLLKGDDISAIEERLRGLERGEVPVSPQIARKLLERFRIEARAPVEVDVAITQRETDVLRAIGRGLTIAEAAHALGIGAHTVGTHVKNIYRKLNIASRAEAAIEAAKRGLV
ncbi:response regulator transcription factor [Novosphingobium sp. KCTC 2891]|uniref:LuxR C-terminal-related transcriptional regulator n=1 Tax=Novosphingobium sp. KCTC 2891 TaxID=2989730 RepID=UPI002221DEBD|nr:response regulator transcription factor [Novosphingobium sp. KCTC 2891]MCW1384114.1 response regulator transcription factor [Novosphingobium sp. KCTC 2891]